MSEPRFGRSDRFCEVVGRRQVVFQLLENQQEDIIVQDQSSGDVFANTRH